LWHVVVHLLQTKKFHKHLHRSLQKSPLPPDVPSFISTTDVLHPRPSQYLVYILE
jgi:hypothetical protein